MTTETEQTAVEAVGTPVATVVTVEPGQMPEVAVMSPRGKLVGVGEAEVFRNDGCRTVSPPAESSHPRTRLAKKREEAADVATCAADQETTLLEITTESPTIPASSAGRGDDAGALTATEDVVHKGPQSTATRVTWADNVKDGETEADASITAPVPQRTRTRTSRKVAPCTPAVAAGDAAKSASDRAQRKAVTVVGGSNDEVDATVPSKSSGYLRQRATAKSKTKVATRRSASEARTRESRAKP
ncbi:hypothetical protein PF003_g6355 [Phytophthora fragariae]|nr:hypothetical protein PF003_g6355 [Phytophthora fragariae]